MFSFSGRSSLPALFETAGLSLDVALTARDSDVIKTYVRIGLGVGILARLAIDPATDSDLAVLDAAHLFEGHTTWIGFRRSALLRAYMYEFIELLAPHLPRKLVRETEKLETQEEVDRILEDLRYRCAITPDFKRHNRIAYAHDRRLVPAGGSAR